MGTVIDLMAERRRRQARGQARRRDGCYLGRSVLQLLEVMEAAVRLAAERFECEPSDVIETHADRVRNEIEPRFGHVPQMRELCDQLRVKTKQPHHWRQWVMVALSEDKAVSKVVEALTRAPELRLKPGDCAIPLRAAAREAGSPTISQPEYDALYQQLVERIVRSGRGREAAERRFPTSGQIVTACGSWSNALEVAGLPQLDAEHHRQSGCPVPDAIAFYFASTGGLPSRKKLEAFAKECDFSLARITGRPWAEWIAAARNRAADFPQLPTLPDYPAAEPDEWSPIEVDIHLPPRGTRGYPRGVVLHALEEFLVWLDGRRPTHRNYRSFCLHKPGTPSLAALLEHGKMAELIGELGEGRK